MANEHNGVDERLEAAIVVVEAQLVVLQTEIGAQRAMACSLLEALGRQDMEVAALTAYLTALRGAARRHQADPGRLSTGVGAAHMGGLGG
jgi:hypothetical protein